MGGVFDSSMRPELLNPIQLRIFFSRLAAICDEMGSILQRSAFSTNIKDRLDFSCAIFDSAGRLCSQAAHIPVHLGSMAYAMAGIIDGFDWRQGDMLILNDPYEGGTHLPDVTLIAPLLVQGELMGFVANRGSSCQYRCFYSWVNAAHKNTGR